jgi:hypothetical protein
MVKKIAASIIKPNKAKGTQKSIISIINYEFTRYSNLVTRKNSPQSAE